jgi:hypothetical protein
MPQLCFGANGGRQPSIQVSVKVSPVVLALMVAESETQYFRSKEVNMMSKHIRMLNPIASEVLARNDINHAPLFNTATSCRATVRDQGGCNHFILFLVTFPQNSRNGITKP